MKRHIAFLALLMLVSVSTWGQAPVSAYQCQPSEAPVSPTLTFTPSAYIQSCFEFGLNTTYLYQPTSEINLEAVNFFKLEPGFTAGEMQPGGSMLMQMAQQPAGYDIFLMSGNSTVGLPRHKKVEFGVQLETGLHNRIEAFTHPSGGNTAEPLNPYLEWKLDVQMIFTHESGIQRKVDAFYYQDFERNMSTKDWDEVATPYPMRVRFSPHLNGKWTVRTTVTVEEVLVAELLPFSFQVVESGHPGYVKVHTNKRNLERNNRMIFPVGHNFPNPVGGVEIGGGVRPNNKCANVEDWLEYHHRVGDYASKGGKYIRTLQAAYSSLIEFENLGDYTNRLHYAWEQDSLLETCENYDLLMMFNLLQQEPIMRYGNFDMGRWDFGHWFGNGTINQFDQYPPYCYYTYPEKDPVLTFTDPTDLKFHKQRTRYYISRYGYSPQIYAWEMVNEPFHLGELSSGSSIAGDLQLEESTRAAVENYHTVISHYIKYDLGHVNHLIAASMLKQIGGYHPPHETDSLDMSPQYSGIDIVTYNPYADAPEKHIITKGNNNRLVVDSNGENSYYGRVKAFHDLFQKPVLFSEAGHVLDNNICSQHVGHYKDVMTFGFTGVAGFNMWAGWASDYGGILDDQTFLQPSTIRAQNHMNGNDVLYTLMSDGSNSGNWQQGREYATNYSTEKLKEHQFYVSSDKLRAVGYISNRSFNRYNNQVPAYCGTAIPSNDNPDYDVWQILKWDSEIMKVDGLVPREHYTIDYYTYKEGNYWFSECVKSNSSGKLNLEHALLDPSYAPVVWYVIRRANCAGKQDGEGESALSPEDDSFSISVVPNPNSGAFMLQVNSGEMESVSVRIFNMFGQQVYARDNVKENLIRLKTGLPAGMYMVEVANENHKQTQKIVIQ